MCKILRCISKDASIAIITLYNAIMTILDLLLLIIALILLGNKNENLGDAIGDVVGIIFLIFALIAIPCICCGICYMWSLFHIQNNLKMARFTGICNFVMMIFTFIIIVSNLKKEEEIERPSIMAFFMILNILSIVATIYLCTINCGFEDETEKEQTRINEMLHHQPEMLEIQYPTRFQNNTSLRYAIEYPDPVIVDIEPLTNNNYVYNAEPIEIIPSAPLKSPSQTEGKITMR